jgi:hypothetical protein
MPLLCHRFYPPSEKHTSGRTTSKGADHHRIIPSEILTRPYRSLIGALTDARGCCYEIAELKLAALEILNFSGGDVRLVGELSTTNGKRDEIGHSVVEVRIDGRNWIMNDQHMRAEFVATRSAFFLASYHSVMEPDCVHVNYSNNSLWTPNVKYFPWGSYNSAYFAGYDGGAR